MSQETAYPLSWPTTQRRHLARNRANFKRDRRPLSVADAIDRLEYQLSLLRVNLASVIVSTNLQPTLRGTPRSGQGEPQDPGVAVYFNFAKKKTALACDIWDRVADNIASIAAHVEALRAIERYGVGTLEQAFRGYQQLEDFSAGVPWRRVLGLKDDDVVTLEIVKTKYRELAKLYHTDINGSDHTQIARLNVAMEQAREDLK
jgi:hypothetical protein